MRLTGAHSEHSRPEKRRSLSPQSAMHFNRHSRVNLWVSINIKIQAHNCTLETSPNICFSRASHNWCSAALAAPNARSFRSAHGRRAAFTSSLDCAAMQSFTIIDCARCARFVGSKLKSKSTLENYLRPEYETMMNGPCLVRRSKHLSSSKWNISQRASPSVCVAVGKVIWLSQDVGALNRTRPRRLQSAQNYYFE